MIKMWTGAAEAGVLERIDAAIADTSKELRAYIKAHAEFIEVGNRVLQQWQQGVAFRLRRPEQTVRPSTSAPFPHDRGLETDY